MEANELRIGNWVIDTFDKCSPVESQIGIDDFVVMGNFSRSNAPIPYSPIPLTEEWLVKLGFEKEPDHFFICWGKNGVELIDYEDGDYEFNHCSTLIKSVHQLQNLYFVLTGEELEITAS